MNYSALFNTIQGYVENDFPSGTFASSTGSGTSSFTAKQQIDTFISRLSSGSLTRFSFLTSEKIKQARFHLPTSI
jgi:hypothetical protein